MIDIYYVEDDETISGSAQAYLSRRGCQVTVFSTEAEARAALVRRRPGLVLVDWNLPDGNGFDFCRYIKEQHPETAVIFLTANDMENDMLKGFEVGADDYVTKPFPISVFQKKVSALLARISRQTTGDLYDDGNLSIDFSGMTATLAGATIAFTSSEYRLLKVLVSNAGVVLTRQVLLEKLWDIDGNFVDEHALTAAVSRVRNKIEKDGRQYIKTVYGMGYMWIGGLQK